MRPVLLLALAWSMVTPAIANTDAVTCVGITGGEKENAPTRIPACTRVIESGKLEPAVLANIYKHRATLFYYQGEFGRAIADFTEMISLTPNSSLGFMLRGGVYFKMGNLEKALADFNKARDMEPNSIAAAHWIRRTKEKLASAPMRQEPPPPVSSPTPSPGIRTESAQSAPPQTNASSPDASSSQQQLCRLIGGMVSQFMQLHSAFEAEQNPLKKQEIESRLRPFSKQYHDEMYKFFVDNPIAENYIGVVTKLEFNERSVSGTFDRYHLIVLLDCPGNTVDIFLDFDSHPQTIAAGVADFGRWKSVLATINEKDKVRFSGRFLFLQHTSFGFKYGLQTMAPRIGTCHNIAFQPVKCPPISYRVSTAQLEKIK